MQKHTQGPWKKIDDFVGPSTFEPVCRMVATNVNTSTQGKANQSLIAAAPELLEALEMVATLDRQLTAGEKRRVASAIAKATAE